MFVIMEFAEAGLGAGAFIGAYVIGMELLGPDRRAFGGTVMMCFDAIGHVSIGVLAMFTQNFRTILLAVHAPALLAVMYIWLLPESFRWLMVNGRREEAIKHILKAAKINRVTLSDTTLNKLRGTYVEPSTNESQGENVSKTIDEKKVSRESFQSAKEKEATATIESETNSSSGTNETMMSVFKSRVLVIRLINCCWCWFIVTFIDYGMTLNSVHLGGDKYINFILSTLVEIPANVFIFILMDKFGRKFSQSGTMLISGMACLAAQFLIAGSSEQLAMFLIGKLFICMAFGIVYMYTAELFPTSIRNVIMSTCCMIGRAGAMLAPQTPLLTNIMPTLPLIIFGVLAIVSGLIVLQLPETKNTKLPDNIKEAINMQQLVTKRTKRNSR